MHKIEKKHSGGMALLSAAAVLFSAFSSLALANEVLMFQ